MERARSQNKAYQKQRLLTKMCLSDNKQRPGVPNADLLNRTALFSPHLFMHEICAQRSAGVVQVGPVFVSDIDPEVAHEQ